MTKGTGNVGFSFAPITCHRGVVTPAASNFLFDSILSNAVQLSLTPSPVRHTAIFQNLLELAVFAKRPVNGEEGEIDISRQLKIFVADIDFENLRPARAQRLGDTASGRERDIAFRTRSTH